MGKDIFIATNRKIFGIFIIPQASSDRRYTIETFINGGRKRYFVFYLIRPYFPHYTEIHCWYRNYGNDKSLLHARRKPTIEGPKISADSKTSIMSINTSINISQ